MPSTPDPSEILKLLDEERRVGADAGATVEKTPHVVRYLSSNWNGITYSCFSSDKADRCSADEPSNIGKVRLLQSLNRRILAGCLLLVGQRPQRVFSLLAPRTQPKFAAVLLFEPQLGALTMNRLTKPEDCAPIVRAPPGKPQSVYISPYRYRDNEGRSCNN